MGSLRYRVAAIAAVTALSLWALFPRTVIERARGPNGEFLYNPDGLERLDTTRRIPIKRGLDLQGGTHLTLEVDESKGAIPNKADAIDRALKVVRTRIDQFGVAEPVVQKAGNDRIVVELPGIDDQKRAVSVVQQSAFLQFQIVDKTQALDKAIPHVDAVLKSKGLAATTPRNGAAAAPNAGVQSLFSTPSDTVKPDTGKAATSASARKATSRGTDKARAAPQKGDTARSRAVPATKSESGASDTGALAGITGGPFSHLVQQGQGPGEYFVAQSDVPTVQRYLALPEVQAALPPGKVVRWESDTVSIGQRVPVVACLHAGGVAHRAVQDDDARRGAGRVRRPGRRVAVPDPGLALAGMAGPDLLRDLPLASESSAAARRPRREQPARPPDHHRAGRRHCRYRELLPGRATGPALEGVPPAQRTGMTRLRRPARW